tara:strand:+ start:306 stop:707 length:402 start_codon:yes stop_codon:yes gene_type:complete
MEISFFSGYKNTHEVLDHLAENLYENFQLKTKVCIALGNDQLINSLKRLRKFKFLKTKQLEYMHEKNIDYYAHMDANADHIHILSDKITDLDPNKHQNIFVYTTEADKNINSAARKLYTNLKKKNYDIRHQRV